SVPAVQDTLPPGTDPASRGKRQIPPPTVQCQQTSSTRQPPASAPATGRPSGQPLPLRQLPCCRPPAPSGRLPPQPLPPSPQPHGQPHRQPRPNRARSLKPR